MPAYPYAAIHISKVYILLRRDGRFTKIILKWRKKESYVAHARIHTQVANFNMEVHTNLWEVRSSGEGHLGVKNATAVVQSDLLRSDILVHAGSSLLGKEFDILVPSSYDLELPQAYLELRRPELGCFGKIIAAKEADVPSDVVLGLER